jgi:hypothetical protein
MQRPRAVLGRWLRHSGEAVSTKPFLQLMERFQEHEPKRHSKADALLQSGSMPALLFSNHTRQRGVNPAMLYIMHASRCPLVVPSTNRTGSLQTSARRLVSPAVCNHMQHLTLTDKYKGAVGVVWWLFNSERPYLAEVFEHGAVPAGRLPHVHRSTIQGRHVARILGQRSHFIEQITPNARRCHVEFSKWYENCASTFLSAGVDSCTFVSCSGN